MDQTLLTHLTTFKITFQEFKHPAVFTVEESNKLKLSLPGMHTKNLFLKSENKDFFLAVLPADSRLNLSKLALLLSVRHLRFGSKEELKSELNLAPGSVSLFGMLYSKSVKLIIDKKVWEAEAVGFHPNINTSTLILAHSAVESFCNSLKIKPLILDISEDA